MEHQFTSSDDGGFGSIWNGYEAEEMLEKMKVGKDTKECFAEMSEYRKMQDGMWGLMMQLDSLEVKKSMEKNQKQVLQGHVPRNRGTKQSQEYLRKDDLLLRLRAIGS